MKLFVIYTTFLAAVVSAEIDIRSIEPVYRLAEWQETYPKLTAMLPPKREFNGRIVLGQEARPHQFPYQVAIIAHLGTGNGLCGGTIVSQNFVLTAAHCLVINGIIGATVRVGAHDFQNPEPNRVDISVPTTNFIVYPDWNPTLIRNDVALLKLPVTIQYNENVQPVLLPRRSQNSELFDNVVGQISGWGRYSDASQNSSPVLRWGNARVTQFSTCQSLFVGIVQESNICTSGLTGNSATCQGDSGGPLTMQESGGSVQIGITSFGIALGCELRLPSVFARTTAYQPWINNNTEGQVQWR